MSKRADALQKLKTTLVDSRSGYEEAVEDAHGAGLATLFQEMMALRTRHIEDINTHLTDMGEPHGDTQSFKSAWNRAAVSLRSVVRGLDADMLPSLIADEQRLVEGYDAALASLGGAEESGAFLAQQRQELVDKIQAMEVLRAKCA